MPELHIPAPCAHRSLWRSEVALDPLELSWKPGLNQKFPVFRDVQKIFCNGFLVIAIEKFL